MRVSWLKPPKSSGFSNSSPSDPSDPVPSARIRIQPHHPVLHSTFTADAFMSSIEEPANCGKNGGKLENWKTFGRLRWKFKFNIWRMILLTKYLLTFQQGAVQSGSSWHIMFILHSYVPGSKTWCMYVYIYIHIYIYICDMVGIYINPNSLIDDHSPTWVCTPTFDHGTYGYWKVLTHPHMWRFPINYPSL